MKRNVMRWRHSCALGLVLAATAAGCGESADPPGVTATSGSAAVGATGAEVTLRDGASAGAAVTIPAGALSATVTITLRDNGVATGLPSGATAAGRSVLFGPEGQTFGAPVTVTVPATGAPNALYTRPASGGAWTPVPGAAWDAARGVMTGAVQHFSEFVPLRLELDAGVDAGAPTDTGAAIDVGVDSGTASDAGPLVCPSGFGNCDANAANGCETNLASSAANCGACGNACPAGRSCVVGVCVAPAVDAGTDVGGAVDTGPLVCPSGYADCDGNAANGCEVNVTSAVAHCGACGRSCTAGQSCAAGACVTPPADAGAPTCAPNRYDCDRNAANGCEVDLLTDALHCGACGSACPAGRTCVAGACR